MTDLQARLEVLATQWEDVLAGYAETEWETGFIHGHDECARQLRAVLEAKG